MSLFHGKHGSLEHKYFCPVDKALLYRSLKTLVNFNLKLLITCCGTEQPELLDFTPQVCDFIIF